MLKGNYGNVSSSELLSLGIDDCYIELIENYPCNNKAELTKREGELIRLHKNDLVNKKIAGRTKKEYCEDNKIIMKEKSKIFRDTNKQMTLDKAKYYHSINREKNKDYAKLHYQNNKQQRLEKAKQYYENNRLSIIAKTKEYYYIKKDLK
jgi:hypothetical protein